MLKVQVFLCASLCFAPAAIAHPWLYYALPTASLELKLHRLGSQALSFMILFDWEFLRAAPSYKSEE